MTRRSRRSQMVASSGWTDSSVTGERHPATRHARKSTTLAAPSPGTRSWSTRKDHREIRKRGYRGCSEEQPISRGLVRLSRSGGDKEKGDGRRSSMPTAARSGGEFVVDTDHCRHPGSATIAALGGGTFVIARIRLQSRRRGRVRGELYGARSTTPVEGPVTCRTASAMISSAPGRKEHHQRQPHSTPEGRAMPPPGPGGNQRRIALSGFTTVYRRC